MFVLALAASLAATPAAAVDPLESISAAQQTLFERMAPSVVFILNDNSFGSGFFIDGIGTILTNAHVVNKATTVTVVLSDGRKLKGQVVERGADDIDVALVKVTMESGSPALDLGASATPRVGQWAAAIGHGAGGIWTFNTGMISNIYPDGAERPVFQTQIPLNPGNSGGPIFNARGDVLGVVTAGMKEANSINFGISLDVARRALAGLRQSCACVRVTGPKGVPLFFDSRMVGTGPSVVVTKVAEGPHEAFAVVNGVMIKRAFGFPSTRDVDLSK